MTHRTKARLISAALLVSAALLLACSKTDTSSGGTVGAQKAARTKEQMIDLGRQHKTASELYRTLRDEAKGGQRLTGSVPDWSGVYTRAPVPGFAFDPDQPADGLPTAKLTPEFRAKMVKR